MDNYTIGIIIIIAVVGVIKAVYSIYLNRNRRAAVHLPTVRNSRPVNRPVRSAVNQRPVNSLANNVANQTSYGPVIYYGNSDHNAIDVEFRFKYELNDGKWRAYIVKQPAFNGRDEALAVTHRYYDSVKRMHYVCWDTPIYQIKDMQNVSKFWADCILEYIATGKRFGPQ